MNVNSHLDKWLFPLPGLPLFVAPLSWHWFWPLTGMLWTQNTERGTDLFLKLNCSIFTSADATPSRSQPHLALVVRLFLGGLFLNAVIDGPGTAWPIHPALVLV